MKWTTLSSAQYDRLCEGRSRKEDIFAIAKAYKIERGYDAVIIHIFLFLSVFICINLLVRPLLQQFYFNKTNCLWVVTIYLGDYFLHRHVPLTTQETLLDVTLKRTKWTIHFWKVLLNIHTQITSICPFSSIFPSWQWFLDATPRLPFFSSVD